MSVAIDVQLEGWEVAELDGAVANGFAPNRAEAMRQSIHLLKETLDTRQAPKHSSAPSQLQQPIKLRTVATGIVSPFRRNDYYGDDGR